MPVANRSIVVASNWNLKPCIKEQTPGSDLAKNRCLAAPGVNVEATASPRAWRSPSTSRRVRRPPTILCSQLMSFGVCQLMSLHVSSHCPKYRCHDSVRRDNWPQMWKWWCLRKRPRITVWKLQLGRGQNGKTSQPRPWYPMSPLRFTWGEIKSFNPSKGYGFVGCEAPVVPHLFWWSILRFKWPAPPGRMDPLFLITFEWIWTIDWYILFLFFSRCEMPIAIPLWTRLATWIGLEFVTMTGMTENLAHICPYAFHSAIGLEVSVTSTPRPSQGRMSSCSNPRSQARTWQTSKVEKCQEPTIGHLNHVKVMMQNFRHLLPNSVIQTLMRIWH